MEAEPGVILNFTKVEAPMGNGNNDRVIYEVIL